jgi:uridine phosphorylase
VAEGRATLLTNQRSEMGLHPVYRLDAGGGRQVALFHPGVGAPLAAGMLEEVIALGSRRFIVCGGAGALDRALTVGHLVVPTSAVRDEGTSYHYMPASREVAAPGEAVAAIEAVLRAEGLPYVLGKTWTTDAIFRETPARIAWRREEGCVTVEMEAATLFAVAQFRGVTLGQILYSGDDLSGPVWDSRGWTSKAEVRAQLLRLAVEACLRL